MKISHKDQEFIKLLQRSKDIGDGWRQVSEWVWPLVDGFGAQELIQRNDKLRRVRLSKKGREIAEYL